MFWPENRLGELSRRPVNAASPERAQAERQRREGLRRLIMRLAGFLPHPGGREAETKALRLLGAAGGTLKRHELRTQGFASYSRRELDSLVSILGIRGLIEARSVRWEWRHPRDGCTRTGSAIAYSLTPRGRVAATSAALRARMIKRLTQRRRCAAPQLGVEQRIVHALAAHGGSLKRHQLPDACRRRLPAATIDQATAGLVDRGLIDVVTATSDYRHPRGHLTRRRATIYHVTDRGRELAAALPAATPGL